ncbi:hypothetical protein [Mycolicibacterium confluentis]|uniref:Uncharacterized protein n=1 Tax=Mycolicibacterium confluentis TaxID=28047 RepID=A0A7I7Y2I8_9MYCO|nr:hypothetical protein [Mycolicibacterium confluentis]MCV7320739.1 hypothetical protein [Mycolicibacterium confluentis]ORV30373.1 hypothetical protein AWB99_14930 [Mycolicibacterium confluentis]BBZ35789.1 hypothetical protein MCNF_43940 [Mycolicibacterium confluentis]
MTAVHDHIDSIAEFDWDLVTFVVQWARYGGPEPEEVLPRFGMTCTRLRERLDEIIVYAHQHPDRMKAEQRELIVRVERWLSTLAEDSPYSAPVDSPPVDPLGVDGQPILSRGIWRWRQETLTTRVEAARASARTD